MISFGLMAPFISSKCLEMEDSKILKLKKILLNLRLKFICLKNPPKWIAGGTFLGVWV
jgi:hypothetical protein